MTPLTEDGLRTSGNAHYAGDVLDVRNDLDVRKDLDVRNVRDPVWKDN